MKTFLRVLSYITTALVAAAVTLYLFTGSLSRASKLEQVESLIKACFIGEADMEAAEDAAAEAMVSSLGDRWSYYLNAKDFAAHMEQSENAYVGIGITIAADEEGRGFLVLVVQERPGGRNPAGGHRGVRPKSERPGAFRVRAAGFGARPGGQYRGH